MYCISMTGLKRGLHEHNGLVLPGEDENDIVCNHKALEHIIEPVQLGILLACST